MHSSYWDEKLTGSLVFDFGVSYPFMSTWNILRQGNITESITIGLFVFLQAWTNNFTIYRSFSSQHASSVWTMNARSAISCLTLYPKSELFICPVNVSVIRLINKLHSWSVASMLSLVKMHNSCLISSWLCIPPLLRLFQTSSGTRPWRN